MHRRGISYLNEEGELESTRLEQAGQVTRRKVVDLTRLSIYNGDERYQREDDKRHAREEEEPHWENVRLDKESMENPYTALNEEMNSLVGDIRYCINM